MIESLNFISYPQSKETFSQTPQKLTPDVPTSKKRGH